MTPSTTYSPPPTTRLATARVPVLLTLAFWPALIFLLIFSPSIIDDLIGFVAIFTVYCLMLIGWGLRNEAGDRRQPSGSRHVRPRQSRRYHGKPTPISGS